VSKSAQDLLAQSRSAYYFLSERKSGLVKSKAYNPQWMSRVLNSEKVARRTLGKNLPKLNRQALMKIEHGLKAESATLTVIQRKVARVAPAESIAETAPSGSEAVERDKAQALPPPHEVKGVQAPPKTIPEENPASDVPPLNEPPSSSTRPAPTKGDAESPDNAQERIEVAPPPSKADTRPPVATPGVVKPSRKERAVKRKPEDFVPADLNSFDGSSWAGLTLGQLTREDLQSQFKVKKDHHSFLFIKIRSETADPNAVQLSLPKNSPMQVFALFNGKGKDATLEAIRIDYALGNAQETSDLEEAFHEKGANYYEAGRMEDWRIFAFHRGVIAFVMSEAGRSSVPTLMLVSPQSLNASLNGLSREFQPVLVQNDPHANEPRVMEFGTVSFDVNLSGLYLKNKEKENIEDSMRSATAGGTMRYREGAPGGYTGSLSGTWTARKGGSITITFEIRGDGPYGPVQGTGTSYKSMPAIKKIEDEYSDTKSINYTVGLYEARANAEKEFKSNMLSSGPPPVETFRLASWQRLQEKFRQSSGETFNR
jgi:hypothetical protein